MWTLPLGGDDIKQKPSAAAFLIPRAITRPSPGRASQVCWCHGDFATAIRFWSLRRFPKMVIGHTFTALRH
jgi:hypothetical protein